MTATTRPSPRTARLSRHVKRALWYPLVTTLFIVCAFLVSIAAMMVFATFLALVGAFDEPPALLADVLHFGLALAAGWWVTTTVSGLLISLIAWALPVSARDIAIVEDAAREERDRLAAADERSAHLRRRADIAEARARSVARSTLRSTGVAGRRRRDAVRLVPAPRVAGTRR